MSSLPRKSYARIPVNIKLPNLIEVQLDSFERLKREGLGDLFHEVSPIESYNKGMKLYFPSRSPEAKQWGLKYWFGDPKHTIEECVERDLTYASPLYVSVLLAGPDVPEPIKQDIFLGDFPEMTDKGTFIINGTERVVVSQLIRSPGVYFEAPTDRATGRSLAMSKLIPDRGAWMEFETRKSDYIILKFNRKRTVPITVFLRALAAVNDGTKDSPLVAGSDEEILSLFQDVDNNPERLFIASTLKQEPEWDVTSKQTIAEAALIEFFKRMRPGDPATIENARQFLEERLEGRTLRENVIDPKTEEVLFKSGETIDAKMLKRIAKIGNPVSIVPFITDQYDYLSADAEDKYVIAQANAPLTEDKEFVRDRVSCRYHSGFIFSTPESVDYMDVAPHQVVGISAALIPFLEHDDANRALMGSNMQAQAVPLVRPEIPLVSTGMEYHAALDSGQVVVADANGEVTSVTGNTITVKERGGTRTYQLRKYQRSNQSTCIDQRPAVVKGQKIKKGDIIADSSSTESGQLALGQNVVVAFLSWEGGNFEDAILISERLVQEDRFTSVHIEKYEVEARDTKLGPEEITRDIPNVGDDAIKDLDENGIIRIGAEVGPNDILVGKITPKGEKELTPEERLLRAIFGEKSRDVKDTSLRMPHGERGKVVDVKVFTREENSDLSAGVDMMVRVSVAQRRKLTAGDKMAGRHGNKGVVSKVVPVEDMPFLEDGTPVDIILNPLGV